MVLARKPTKHITHSQNFLTIFHRLYIAYTYTSMKELKNDKWIDLQNKNHHKPLTQRFLNEMKNGKQLYIFWFGSIIQRNPGYIETKRDYQKNNLKKYTYETNYLNKAT